MTDKNSLRQLAAQRSTQADIYTQCNWELCLWVEYVWAGMISKLQVTKLAPIEYFHEGFHEVSAE